MHDRGEGHGVEIVALDRVRRRVLLVTFDKQLSGLEAAVMRDPQFVQNPVRVLVLAEVLRAKSGDRSARPTRLAAGCLIALGLLVLLSPFLQRRHTSHRGDTFTSVIFLVTLVAGGLVLSTLSSFRAAIPLYAVAVMLFVWAIGRRFETRLGES